MKVFKLLIAFLLITNFSYSQWGQNNYENSEIIWLTPRSSNGYLAWDVNYPEAKYWKVSVEKNNFSNGVFIGSNIEWRNEVWNQNYLIIPQQFYKN